MYRRDLTITLAGTRLELKFESENMYELTAITGIPYFTYVRLCSPKDGETKRDAAERCADLHFLVPLIMAGLAHHDEYADLTHRQLRRKVCGLIDGEAAKRGEPAIIVQAGLVEAILPVLARTFVAPGTDIDAAIKEAEAKEAADKAVPLPENAVPDAPETATSPAPASS